MHEHDEQSISSHGGPYEHSVQGYSFFSVEPIKGTKNKRLHGYISGKIEIDGNVSKLLSYAQYLNDSTNTLQYRDAANYPEKYFLTENNRRVEPPPVRESVAVVVNPTYVSHRALSGFFVGRDAQVNEIFGLIGDPSVWLVTLWGPPGIGKTELALRIMERINAGGSGNPVGCAFVSLEGVESKDGLVAKVNAALGISDKADE
ncbi:MAG: hypothetical protein HQK89_16660, partial [Nitrospirae bacterium]|nr:hypothetical protein [Nitrospirota bacterium]